jgi:tetratricopeptide (TPR) repeat protein
LALIHEKVPLFFLAGAAIIVTILAQKNGGSISNLESVPLYIRVENATISYMAYLVKMVWPIHLALFYPYPRMVNLYKVITAFLLLIGITWMVVQNIRRFPFLFVGWFWYLSTLAPVIGIIQVGSQSMADRYTYVPLIGIFILIVWGLSKLLGHLRPAQYILAGIYCAIVPVIMWFTWLQTGYWASNISIFSHAVEVTNDNYLAHNSLGVALCEHGEFDAGVKHYMEALRIYPEHVQAHNNLGAALVKEGKYKDSIGHFRKALQIDPGFVSAHYNLGIAYYAIGKLDEAIKQYQEVLRLAPQYPEASLKMATAITKQRKINDAIARLNDALKTNPQDYTILCKVAELYNDEGNTKEAINHYESALSLNPGLTRILHVLVILYAENGEYDKSLLLLHRMAKLNPDDPDVYYNIACIYSMQGKMDDAILFLEDAIHHGFNKWDIIKNDRDLENIRGTEGYKKIIQK